MKPSTCRCPKDVVAMLKESLSSLGFELPESIEARVEAMVRRTRNCLLHVMAQRPLPEVEEYNKLQWYMYARVAIGWTKRAGLYLVETWTCDKHKGLTTRNIEAQEFRLEPWYSAPLPGSAERRSRLFRLLDKRCRERLQRDAMPMPRDFVAKAVRIRDGLFYIETVQDDREPFWRKAFFLTRQFAVPTRRLEFESVTEAEAEFGALALSEEGMALDTICEPRPVLELNGPDGLHAVWWGGDIISIFNGPTEIDCVTLADAHLRGTSDIITAMEECLKSATSTGVL